MPHSLVPRGKRLFRFVVIADTHVNQSDERASAFFALNRLANGRADLAFRTIAACEPEFVIHLGDIVHPIPSHPDFGRAAANYRALAAGVQCPVYLTPGNHDIGDKPWPLAPVARIEPAFIEAYEREFGRQWFQWSHRDCHFFVLNTSLMNSGLPQEAEQRAWFERAVAGAAGRKFLALHYPPYVRRADEGSHYDNIDEPARGWLLERIERHGLEAVFCGHVHNLWYDQFADTELYLLPSTAFVRQDYSEMQRVTPPGEEGGRQDADKLGFFVVDVFDSGHVARFVRLPGTARAADALPDTGLHCKSPALPNLGVDPCYPWADDVIVPASGALDAFDSKVVRNDYPLFALLELGIGLMRVPLSDFERPGVLARFRQLARIGMRVQVVVHAPPRREQIAVLESLGSALEAVEWVATVADLRAGEETIRTVMRALPAARLVLGKLREPADAAVDGLQYGHLVFHGWVMAEAGTFAELGRRFAADRPAEIQLRVRCADSPLQIAGQAHAFSQASGVPARLLVRLSTDNPAQAQDDEATLCRLVLEAVVAAQCYPDLRVVIEGLVDFDRGYFLRLGLVDRSFNPRLPARAARHLQDFLASHGRSALRARACTEDGLCRIDIEHDAGLAAAVVVGASAPVRATVAAALAAGDRCWRLDDGRAVHGAGEHAPGNCQAVLIERGGEEQQARNRA